MYRRALVVDDEPAICDLIQKVLFSAGLEALTLTRSAEAPGLLEEGKFDVVFLDLHMPSPDGIELARQIKAHRILPPGSSVSLRLHLSGRMKPIVATGLVVRILEGNQMGIHFDQLDLTESERLQEYLLPLVLADTARSSATAL